MARFTAPILADRGGFGGQKFHIHVDSCCREQRFLQAKVARDTIVIGASAGGLEALLALRASCEIAMRSAPLRKLSSVGVFGEKRVI